MSKRPTLPDGRTMAALSERQRLFAEKYVELGGKHGSAQAAALHAGYGGGGETPNVNSAKSRAWELLRNPDVLAAIRDEMTRKLSAAAVLGVNVLVELAEDEGVPAATRLSAAKELVDRGYGPVASRFMHTHEGRTIEDYILMAEEAERSGGLAVEAVAIEADFEEAED